MLVFNDVVDAANVQIKAKSSLFYFLMFMAGLIRSAKVRLYDKSFAVQ